MNTNVTEIREEAEDIMKERTSLLTDAEKNYFKNRQNALRY